MVNSRKQGQDLLLFSLRTTYGNTITYRKFHVYPSCKHMVKYIGKIKEAARKFVSYPCSLQKRTYLVLRKVSRLTHVLFTNSKN